jgi:hypothetical protein
MKKITLMLLLLACATAANAQTSSSFNMSITVLPLSAHTFKVNLEYTDIADVRYWHCPNAQVVEDWDNITFNCYHESFSSHYTFALNKDENGTTSWNIHAYAFDSNTSLLTFDYTKVFNGRWEMPPRPRIVYNGTIDEVVFYNHKISDKEIHALYRKGLSG